MAEKNTLTTLAKRLGPLMKFAALEVVQTTPVDHGSLLGLLDDDHTQYAMAEGSGTRRAYEAGRLNKNVLAGNGLAGGGLLTGDVTLSVGAGLGIASDPDVVRIDTTTSLTWTGAHTFQGQLSTRHILPEATDTYDIGSSTKLFRKGWLSELDAIMFAENTITLLGGWLLISKDEGSLQADVDSSQTLVDFGKAMSPGDFVLFRAAGKVEYMQVGALYSLTIYNVTRDLDGSGGNDWPAGTPFAVLGQSGNGRIELNAYDTPRLQILKQGATYNAQTELIRLGDLNGNWGYSAQKFGFALGEYAAGKPNIVLDEDGNLKFRLYTTDVMTFAGGNADITGKLRMPGASSAIAIGSTPPTGPAAGTGIWLDRTGLYGLAGGTLQVKLDAATGKLTAGNVVLDNSSISVLAADALASNRTYGFRSGSTLVSAFQGYKDAANNFAAIDALDVGVDSSIYVRAYAGATKNASAGLLAVRGTNYATIEVNYDSTGDWINLAATKIRLNGSLYVDDAHRSATFVPFTTPAHFNNPNTIFRGQAVGSGNSGNYAITSWSLDNSVPAGAIALAVEVDIQAAATGVQCFVSGNSTYVNAVGARTQVANLWISNAGNVPVNSGNIYISINGNCNLWITVWGYYI